MRYFQKIIIGFLILGLSGCATDDNKNAENNVSTIYFQLGVRYLNLGKLEVAKENLQRAIKLDSKNAAALNALAFLHEKLGKTDQAQAFYEQAISLSPADLSIKNNYGRFLCEQEDVQKGIGLLTEAVDDKLNEHSWLAMTNLGRCYMKLAQYQKAEMYFLQALQFNQDYAPALFEMQKVSYQEKNLSAANNYLQQYEKVGEQSAEFLFSAIQIKRALGNLDSATHYQSLLLTKFPLSVEATRLK